MPWEEWSSDLEAIAVADRGIHQLAHSYVGVWQTAVVETMLVAEYSGAGGTLWKAEDFFDHYLNYFAT